MTYDKRYPIGTGTYTSNEPPRYVPHAPAPYAPPLSEADTWPSVPRYPVNPHAFGQASPRRVYLTPTPTPTSEPMPVASVPVRPAKPRTIWRPRHSRLGWRVRAVGWALVDLWGEMRLCGGWLSEVAFLVVLAALGAGVVVSVLLLWFWLSGAGM